MRLTCAAHDTTGDRTIDGGSGFSHTHTNRDESRCHPDRPSAI